ncbi:FtsW/RodA/SpoVE family cell cycle protein [Xylocopilactobacillus apicola]|uniref:Probable peptidoglycan glycosyltransferase FtsW n=1 Tax=Xylocopilactobacillus apicola TaxID=2932184 RepID=A0AAU9DTE7_9LACO|nr:FtsW/RodA/SpoVE family cell cycle protein [Xylocopilactobacillus apicola]BDR59389.1 cell division protein FtsW [Xylocopilactobacillus apicola]
MKNQEKKFKYDRWLLYPYLFLSVIGILMVYSASANITQSSVSSMSPLNYLIRQSGYFLIGLFLVYLFAHLRFDFLRQGKVTNSFFLIVVMMLIFLLFHGKAVNGASAWISLGPINIQPSEFAKLAITLYLARILAKREEKMKPSWRNLAPYFKSIFGPLCLVGLVCIIVFFQPDTGGFLSLALITIMIVAISGIPWVIGVSTVVFLFLLAGGAIYGILDLYNKHILSKLPYQILRVIAFADPWKNSSSSGVQLTNSYFAINNGGWFGVGIGNSIQKHGYLPEQNTDFILSIVAEELGIMTVILILIAIFMIIVRAMILAIRSRNNYYSMISIGVATTFFIQTVFNVGGVTGLLPITGVTLPFISYGGSSVMLLSIELGLLFHISNLDRIRRIEAKVAIDDKKN